MRKVLSAILVLMLIPVVIAQIAASSARTLLTDADFTKEAVQESGLYLQMETYLVDQLSRGFQNSEIPFTRAEISTVVGGVLPPSRLRQLAETAIDGVHRWFWSGAARPDIILDLTDARNALPGVLRPIIVAKVEALPVCTAAQAAQLAVSYKGGMPPCKSPSADFNKMVIDRAIPNQELQKLMPGRVDLAAELEIHNGPEFWRELSVGMQEARRGLNLIPLGWGAVAVLLGLLAVLNLDRWYTPFGWMAAPLLIGGGLLLVVSMVGVNLALPIIRDQVVTGDATGGLAFSVIRVVVEAMFVSMRNLSMIVSLTGLACVITAVAGKLISPPDARSRVA